MRITGDRASGRLLGVQLFGHLRSEIAERIDSAAHGIFHGAAVDDVNDLDLSYTPPLGSSWDAIQTGTQAWIAFSGLRARTGSALWTTSGWRGSL